MRPTSGPVPKGPTAAVPVDIGSGLPATGIHRSPSNGSPLPPGPVPKAPQIGSGFSVIGAAPKAMVPQLGSGLPPTVPARPTTGPTLPSKGQATTDFPPIGDIHMNRGPHKSQSLWRPVLTQTLSEPALLVRSVLPGVVSVGGLAPVMLGHRQVGTPMLPEAAQPANTGFPLQKLRRSNSGVQATTRMRLGPMASLSPQPAAVGVLGARPGVAFPPISPPRAAGTPMAFGSATAFHVVGQAASLSPLPPPSVAKAVPPAKAAALPPATATVEAAAVASAPPVSSGIAS